MKGSNASIDRLGERLRSGTLDDADLRELDSFRRSFQDPYQVVVTTLRDALASNPTGRPAKSTTSVIEKLRRESVRLTQIQDIAGCRVIVPDCQTQDSLVASVRQHFETVSIFDRRVTPSSGYRAIHVIVRVDGRPVEVQVRTAIQHAWAELSEKMADLVDPAIKYGGGPAEARQLLDGTSKSIETIEKIEIQVASIRAHPKMVVAARLVEDVTNLEETLTNTDPTAESDRTVIDEAKSTLAQAKAMPLVQKATTISKDLKDLETRLSTARADLMRRIHEIRVPENK